MKIKNYSSLLNKIKYRCFKLYLFIINQIKLYYTKNISTLIAIVYFPFIYLSIIISTFLLFLAVSYLFFRKKENIIIKKKLI